MDSRRWNRIKEIFDEAYERPSSERKAFVHEAAGGDLDLANEIISLLAEDDSMHSILDGVALDASDILDEHSRQGTRIGPYILKRQLGVGGMGEVYLADRADGEFEHQVALKLLRGGIQSDQILARFRAERQILARLQHPNIARLLDGGMTDEGQPYFVLEYIEGLPIDQYANTRGLDIGGRLELFDQVCRAVTYAHANLVVHRDLKPTNILVTDDGRVKLLDFGIAKVLSDDTNGDPNLTRTGAALMTPAYASPEQARGEPINTATDIYSLGVVLYELLTGLRPYQVDDKNPLEAARVICEVQPDRPSTAVTATTSLTTSSTHGSDAGRLKRLLSGDLDIICLKALRKEVDRRYTTSDELGEDVRRFLSGKPIEARSESVTYRAGKFAKRHRLAVGLAAGVLLLVTALTVFYTVRLTEERNRAQLETEKARQVAGFLQGVFSVSDPRNNPGENLTAREILDQGAARLEEELSDQPEVLAEMFTTIGSAYDGLGLYTRWNEVLLKSLKIKQSLNSGVSYDIAEAMSKLGASYWRLGDHARADSLFEAALEIHERLTSDPNREKSELLNNFGISSAEQGRYEKADSLHLRSLEIRKTIFGDDHLDVAASLHNLARVKDRMGKFAEADSLYSETTKLLRDAHGDLHPDLAVALKSQADLQLKLGDTDRAEELYLETIAMAREMYDQNHPTLGTWLRGYAKLLVRKGDVPGAQRAAQEAYDIQSTTLGPDHPHTIAAINQLAQIYFALKEYPTVDSLLAITLKANERQFGKKHRRYATDLHQLALSARRQNKLQRALTFESEALDVYREIQGPSHPDIANSLHGLGTIMLMMGRVGAAETYANEALAMRKEFFDLNHPSVRRSQDLLDKVLEQ